MTRSQIVLLVIVLVVLVAGALLLLARRRARTASLRGTFGAEYDRTVQRSGDRRDAERELAERRERARALELRPLSAASRERYQASWVAVQTRFLDAPEAALSEADRLVGGLMEERGFPSGSRDSQEELLSVEHTAVVESFRAGHAIEQAAQDGRATTEQVRQAMLHFRTVFEELLGERDAPPDTRPGDADRDDGAPRPDR